MYPKVVSKRCIQKMYPKDLSKWCIQKMYLENVSREYVQKIYPYVMAQTAWSHYLDPRFTCPLVMVQSPSSTRSLIRLSWSNVMGQIPHGQIVTVQLLRSSVMVLVSWLILLLGDEFFYNLMIHWSSILAYFRWRRKNSVAFHPQLNSTKRRLSTPAGVKRRVDFA